MKDYLENTQRYTSGTVLEFPPARALKQLLTIKNPES